ncbi:hypothetical protein P167DRAFT_490675 [Morchella conica CCBAS932]|uniref:Uncharacterized protein n=1 Tax=Morchella conica CCBAS932 TaxID=1392247 RepID=A0A3N4KJB9_9PEZI|nr:hypothetical protein P167DRAFT_490675 [Morchella conica CCBAS932]
MSGSPSFAKIAFPPAPPNGQRRVLVTSWARPLRTPNYAYNHDDMYLAMEDGDIFFLEVDTEGPNLIQLANKACHLDCSIGTAFASLDFGLTKNDMLVAGGEMSSGGVYLLKIGPHPVETEPKLEESVANWSPVFDFDLVKIPAQGHRGKAERDRVFACTGRGDHGAITELRYGIQARIQGSAEYHSGVRRLWVLPDSSGAGYFLLSSLPDRSSLCFLTPSGDWEEASEFGLLEMDETTLAAGAVGALSVQVTPRTIIITQLKKENLTLHRDGGDVDVPMADIGMDMESPLTMKDECNVGEIIVAAALKDQFLVVAIRKGVVVELILATIQVDENTGKFLNPVGLPTTLSEDPTFITILEINQRMLVVVGTQKATIQMFLFDLLNGLIPLLDKPMYEGNTEGQLALFTCESVALLAANNSLTLLCGLRGGTVLALNVKWERCLTLERIEEIKFGPTPVQLHPDVRRYDSAFVLAGPELFRFDSPNGKFRASQVVFEESDVEPSLVAFAQINSLDSENIVIGMTKDQIFYADVGESEKVCVRRLRLNETPRKLLFYKPLNVLIVACSRTASDDPRVESERHIPGRRRSFCSLRFIDPRTSVTPPVLVLSPQKTNS